MKFQELHAFVVLHSIFPRPLSSCRFVASAFGLLRYSFGGDRPSQTAQQALSRVRIHGIPVRVPEEQEWYFTDDSTRAEALASTSPTYATHALLETNTSLQ